MGHADRPIVYFAMGSSGTPEIIRNILRSFEGTPYRVIAPIRSFFRKTPDFVVPNNVVVTDWLPALKVNQMADIAVIHGGIGTVMTAALAGKPISRSNAPPSEMNRISKAEWPPALALTALAISIMRVVSARL
jgi:hypothetical protein